MIYKKDANFPYPIITEMALAYADSTFKISVGFEEDGDVYRFRINREMTSHFVNDLLACGQAEYLLVIQSKDTKFYRLRHEQMNVEILKRNISLANRTAIQLHIVTKEVISFAKNEELTGLYDSMKNQIEVGKYSMIGYSNIVTFEGSMKNPTQLFEKRFNTELKTAIKYEMGIESIIIHFREEESQLQSVGSAFMNPYLYTGLRAALERFVRSHADEDEEFVEIQELEDPTDLLDYKLYNLMKHKSVVELNIDNIDEVIERISNGIIDKYVLAAKGLKNNNDED